MRSRAAVPSARREYIGVVPARVGALIVGVGRSHLPLAILVGLCCSTCLFLTAGSTLIQAGWLDPYVYVGYMNDYAGLLERFGRTYYSERIAYIYPAHAFTYLFGLQGGYFAFRYVALTSAVAAVFMIGMRFYGFAPAMLAAVWLSFTPWLPRSLFWTYPDGLAVVYVLVGAALLIVPIHKRLTCHVAAGATFALAVNCNLFLLPICGLLGPGLAFFYRREGVVWLAQVTLALAIGFFATLMALGLILYIQFPNYGFFVELASFREAISLFGGDDEVWYKPLSWIIWENENFALLIPITFLPAAILLVVRRSLLGRTVPSALDFEVLAVVYLMSVICFFLLLHFGFHSPVLSLPYYIIYCVPGCVLAMLALSGEVQQRGGRNGNAILYCGTALVLVAWFVLPALADIRSIWSLYSWLAVGGLTVAAAAALRRTAIASVAVIAGAVLLSLCLYQNGFYDIRTSSNSEREWDVYRGAIFLQQFVKSNVRASQSVGFWYKNNREIENDRGYDPFLYADWKWRLLNSVQSTFLWGYTRVFPSSPAPGMPVVDEELRGKVAARHFLVLLGLSDDETNVGLGALEKADMRFREVNRAHFQGRTWGYTAVLVEMKRSLKSLGPFLSNVPLKNFEPTNGASIKSLPGGEGLQLMTAMPQWSYSLIGHLETVHGPVVMRVRLQVEQGQVGIAFAGSGNISDLHSEQVVESAPETQEVDVDITDASVADLLIVRNRSTTGASRVILDSVEVFRPAGIPTYSKARERALGPSLFSVPTARLEPANGATVSSVPSGAGLRFTTAAPQWSYSLTAALRPYLTSLQGAAVMRVRLKVEEGRIGLAVSHVGNNSALIQEIGVGQTPEAEEVYVDIPDLSAAELLIVRNQSAIGPSRALIYSVDVLRPEKVAEEQVKSSGSSLGSFLFTLPLVHLQPVNGATISSVGDGAELQLTTAEPQWTYSATQRLDHESVSGPVVVRVRLKVDEGKIGVGVSSVGNISRLIGEIDAEPSPESQDVYVDVPDASAADLLVIRNQSPNGASRVIVQSVDVLRPN